MKERIPDGIQPIPPAIEAHYHPFGQHEIGYRCHWDAPEHRVTLLFQLSKRHAKTRTITAIWTPKNAEHPTRLTQYDFNTKRYRLVQSENGKETAHELPAEHPHAKEFDQTVGLMLSRITRRVIRPRPTTKSEKRQKRPQEENIIEPFVPEFETFLDHARRRFALPGQANDLGDIFKTYPQWAPKRILLFKDPVRRRSPESGQMENRMPESEARYVAHVNNHPYSELSFEFHPPTAEDSKSNYGGHVTIYVRPKGSQNEGYRTNALYAIRHTLAGENARTLLPRLLHESRDPAKSTYSGTHPATKNGKAYLKLMDLATHMNVLNFGEIRSGENPRLRPDQHQVDEFVAKVKIDVEKMKKRYASRKR